MSQHWPIFGYKLVSRCQPTISLMTNRSCGVCCETRPTSLGPPPPPPTPSNASSYCFIVSSSHFAVPVSCIYPTFLSPSENGHSTFFPLSEDRSETPLATFDSANPYTGLELIVSGLPHSTPDDTTHHLNDILGRLREEGVEFPALKVTPPSNVQPQDFVYVSLTGTLRETPRPDILDSDVQAQAQSPE
jgi:hypothetical protein